MTVRCILFDNDGTLVDTHDLILSSMRFATRRVLGEVLPDDYLMRKVGIPLDAQMADFADGDDQVREELLRVYRGHNHEHHDEAVRAFPGVLAGLEQLQSAGFSLGVVTSKMAPLAQRGLEIVGAWDYMGCLVGAADCPKAKPEPDPILLAANKLGMLPSECVYLGDSPFDIQAGNAAGCISAAATWGMFDEEQLLAQQPDAVFDSFEEFARYWVDNA